jgi:hypothetical protein
MTDSIKSIFGDDALGPFHDFVIEITGYLVQGAMWETG